MRLFNILVTEKFFIKTFLKSISPLRKTEKMSQKQLLLLPVGED